MHTQIGHSIPESAYSNGPYPYSISMPSMYNQNSFPYNANNSSSNAHGLSHGTSVSQQAYPGISMQPYQQQQQLEHSQYHLSNVPPNKQQQHNSGSSTADSNTSNGSEFDVNRNSVKKRRKPAPTIATGRRNLKNETVAPEEAERRIKRRERNRKSAQRCRERKIEKKETLQKEINDVNQKSRKYLDLAENILKAWKERLRFLDENLPGHNFKSQLSVMEFEQLIDACSSRNNEHSEAGDTCSPRSSVVDPSMVNPIKQEYVLAPAHVGQNTPNSNFMTCGKMEQFYQTSFTSDLLPPNVVHSGYDQYHHGYTNDNSMGYI